MQALRGHRAVRTTMLYTHTVTSITLQEAKSPLDLYFLVPRSVSVANQSPKAPTEVGWEAS